MAHKKTSTKLELRRMKATEIRVDTAADGSNILAGYAVVFGVPSVDFGNWNEICNPGMFTRTLRENPDVVMLRDHVSSQLLGRTTAGTLTLKQDAKGLAFTVTLPKTAIALDTLENVRNQNLSNCSFGFNVPDGGDVWQTNPDGTATRFLNDVNLAEVSITSFAAYKQSSVQSLRSCPPEIRSLITRSNDDGCDCDCEECLDDDCDNCSMDDCEDPNCAENGCPAQNHDERSKPLSQSETHKLHMRLELSKRK